jgi:hypothetical protein
MPLDVLIDARPVIGRGDFNVGFQCRIMTAKDAVVGIKVLSFGIFVVEIKLCKGSCNL